MNWEAGNVPEGWKLSAIGDVAKIVGGGTPKTSVAGNFSAEAGHAWITPADLTGYTEKYIGHGRRYLTDQGLATSSAKYMPAGTVLFSSRAPIGYVAVAANPVTTNQGFRSFVPSSDIDSNYLYHALKFLRPVAEHLASGTTFAELSGSNAARMHIAFPSLDAQRFIANLLDNADRSERNVAAHLASARRSVGRFRQAVLAAACSGRLTAEWREANPGAVSVEHAVIESTGSKRPRKHAEQAVEIDFPSLPESYYVAPIGDASVRLEYGTSQRSEAHAENGVPVLRMGNIQDGHLDLADLKYRSVDAEIERLLLEDGDLLFNRTNSPELVGKAAVFHGVQPTSFASYLIRVRFEPSIADPDFVNYWIGSSWGRAWARQVKTDGVSQSNINGSKLSLMPVPLPPVEEQREIVSRASSMLHLADGLLARIDTARRSAERSAHALRAKAFRGELRQVDRAANA